MSQYSIMTSTNQLCLTDHDRSYRWHFPQTDWQHQWRAWSKIRYLNTILQIQTFNNTSYEGIHTMHARLLDSCPQDPFLDWNKYISLELLDLTRSGQEENSSIDHFGIQIAHILHVFI